MKKVTVICSERGDFDFLFLGLADDEPLRQGLQIQGISRFAVLGVDPDDSSQVEDGDTFFIRVFSAESPECGV